MVSLAKERARLADMTAKELRAEYLDLFGESIAGNNKTWMLRRILWRLQARAEGGLSERARRLAEELADDSQLRVVPPGAVELQAAPLAKSDSRLPMPGTLLTRQYKGALALVQVQVLADGFEYRGDRFKTLSAVAKAITGSHTNGYLFFHLAKENA